MKLFKRLPITVLLPALFALPLLLVSVVLVVLASSQARTTVEALVGETLTQLERRILQRVTRLAALPARINALNGTLLREGRLDPEDPRGWQAVFAREMLTFSELSSVTWGSPNGYATWVARYAGDDHLVFAIKDADTGTQIEEFVLDETGAPQGEPSNHYDYVLEGRPWYRTSLDVGRAAWTPPFVWAGGDPSIPPTLGLGFGSPQHAPDGELVGVFDAELTLDDLSDYLAALDLPEDGVVVIVDAEGRLLANSVAAPVTREEEVLLATTSGDARVAALGRLLDADVPVPGTLELDGETWWVRAAPFHHETGLSWHVGLLVPQRAFLATVDEARARHATIAAAAVLLTTLLGIALALMLARPLSALERHARRIGRGEIDTEVDLGSTREIARLSAAINDMAIDLRDRLRLRDQVRDAAISIQSASTTIATTAGQQQGTVDAVRSSTTRIAAAIAEIAATGEALSKAVEEVGDAARASSELADTGRLDLAEMGTTMQALEEATVGIQEALGELANRAQGVHGIIGAIVRVVDQTNILAINAAIEAERAGEYGAGFRVVAREVANVADQTAEAALGIEKDIHRIDEAMTANRGKMAAFGEQVRDVVGRVGRIGDRFAKIIAEIASATDRFESVRRGIVQQAGGLRDIDDAMAGLAQTAEETSASLDQFRHAADRLRNASDDLSSEMGRLEANRDGA